MMSKGHKRERLKLTVTVTITKCPYGGYDAKVGLWSYYSASKREVIAAIRRQVALLVQREPAEVVGWTSTH